MASLENGINGDCKDQHVDTAGTVSDFKDRGIVEKGKGSQKIEFYENKKQSIVFNRATGTTQPTRDPGCV